MLFKEKDKDYYASLFWKQLDKDGNNLEEFLVRRKTSPAIKAIQWNGNNIIEISNFVEKYSPLSSVKMVYSDDEGNLCQPVLAIPINNSKSLVGYPDGSTSIKEIHKTKKGYRYLAVITWATAPLFTFIILPEDYVVVDEFTRLCTVRPEIFEFQYERI